MGKLFARLAAVAKDNPLATRREGYSAEQLSTISDDNRWICFPYPRLMNANAIIDQAAAVLMTSVEKAREWGIPEDRWVFLHGCADGTDTWVVSERDRLDASPAIHGCARLALDMAGKKMSDVGAFDLYSCFPSAVEVAMKEIGIAEDDPRPISVTGGLPFFGGPGNNYVTHSIAEMMNVVRAKPGSFGMVTANGMYLTKHSAGLYSTAPTAGPVAPRGPEEAPGRTRCAAEADGQQGAERAPARSRPIASPMARRRPRKPISSAAWTARANASSPCRPNDPALLADMLTNEQLGRKVTVNELDGRNVFRPI